MQVGLRAVWCRLPRPVIVNGAAVSSCRRVPELPAGRLSLAAPIPPITPEDYENQICNPATAYSLIVYVLQRGGTFDL